MTTPRVYADFQNADPHGRIRLNCAGTMRDLAEQHVELREGLQLLLHTDDCDDRGELDELLASGTVRYSGEENTWVAEVDWSSLRHASDNVASQAVPSLPQMPGLETPAVTPPPIR